MMSSLTPLATPTTCSEAQVELGRAVALVNVTAYCTYEFCHIFCFSFKRFYFFDDRVLNRGFRTWSARFYEHFRAVLAYRADVIRFRFTLTDVPAYSTNVIVRTRLRRGTRLDVGVIVSVCERLSAEYFRTRHVTQKLYVRAEVERFLNFDIQVTDYACRGYQNTVFRALGFHSVELVAVPSGAHSEAFDKVERSSRRQHRYACLAGA